MSIADRKYSGLKLTVTLVWRLNIFRRKYHANLAAGYAWGLLDVDSAATAVSQLELLVLCKATLIG